MELLLFCFCLGFAGFLVMALMGGLHGGAHGSPQPHGWGGHGHGSLATTPAQAVTGSPGTGAHGALSSGHGGYGTMKTGAAGKTGFGADWKSLTVLLSPRVFFSLLMGFGAVGLLLHPHLAPPLPILLALPGAIIFEFCLVNPLWKALFRFASNPARTLEDSLLEEAEATTDFDASGRGMVRLHLNGEVVQMLARLHGAEGEPPVRVRSGDKLAIIAVNPQRNSCTVAAARRESLS